MKESLATFDDVSAAVDGGVDDERQVFVESILARVSSKIRGEAKQDWVDELGSLLDVPDEVVAIAIDATLRAMNVTPGVRVDTVETTGATYVQAAAEGIYLTADEKTTLRRYRPTAQPGLSAIETTGSPRMYERDGLAGEYYAVSYGDGTYGTPIRLPVWP